MNAKTWIPLALALVMGLVAALVGRSMMSHKPAVTIAEKKSQMVVIKEGVGAGDVLHDIDLTVAAVPPESVPAAGFNDPKALEGRTVSVSLTKGEPVTENLLVPVGMGAGIGALIPEGMRAITVEINEISGVAGLLIPGSHVDLVGTIGNQNPDESQSRTIAENIKIIAVGQKISNTPTPSPDGQPQGVTHSVTLLVTPKQAELVEISARFANPRLVLRNPLDGSHMGESTGITLAEIRGHREKAENTNVIVPVMSTTQQVIISPTTLPVASARDNTSAADTTVQRVVQIIKGGNVSTVTFVEQKPQSADVKSDPSPMLPK